MGYKPLLYPFTTTTCSDGPRATLIIMFQQQVTQTHNWSAAVKFLELY